jgi:hypothetical protein
LTTISTSGRAATGSIGTIGVLQAAQRVSSAWSRASQLRHLVCRSQRLQK